MDILRRELDEIYKSQRLNDESLPVDNLTEARRLAESYSRISDGCAVVTDASCDRCHVYSGSLGVLMGYAQTAQSSFEADSSDEDVVYERIHPEDLVDKRLLELEFFKLADVHEPDLKLQYTAHCRLRMKDHTGIYRIVDNTTQLASLSPLGKIWLILCTYRLSADTLPFDGIHPAIVNTVSGDIIPFSFNKRRKEILSDREKEVLSLIRDGKPSKQIADILGISIHTVNRHRQNILEKLSVGNSVEAVTAATLMKLF